MNSKILIPILAGALIVSWAIYALSLPTPPSPPDTATRNPAAQPPMPATTAEAQALRGEIELLKSQVSMLQDALRKHPALGETVADEPSASQTTISEARRHEDAREAMNARIDAIDAYHVSETVDDQWSHMAETRILEGLQGETLAQATIQEVDCRSTLCRVALNTSRQSDLVSLRMDLAVGLGDLISKGAMRVVEQDANHRQVVFYLSRSGYGLPVAGEQVESTMQ